MFEHGLRAIDARDVGLWPAGFDVNSGGSGATPKVVDIAWGIQRDMSQQIERGAQALVAES